MPRPKTPPPDPRFEELCHRLRADQTRIKVPGVALGVYHNGQTFTAGFGRTSLENPLRVTPATLFQVGSISKTFTTTALMRLVETGDLDLDVPLRKLLPKFKMADKETEKRLSARHLLTHTGGWVGDYFNDFGNGDDALKQMVKKIGKLPQITPLGSLWSYNNTGFNLASRLLETLTGKPYETAMQDLLLTPLGLTQTYFYPNDLFLTHRFVCGHQTVDGKVKVTRPWAIGRAGNGVGGVISAVPDLLQYARFHMGEHGQEVLSQASLQAMRQPQADAGGFRQMGLSWFIRRAGEMEIYGHGGATHGQQAALHFIPSQNFAVVLLVNSDEGGILTDKILSQALEIYFNVSLPAPTPLETAPETLTEYAGTYDLPISAYTLQPQGDSLLLNEIPRGGFPTPQTPPGPAMPPVRFQFYAPDKIIGLDEPMKGSLAEFFRDETGAIRFLRLGGRVHPKVS